MKKLIVILGAVLLSAFLWYRWALGAPGNAGIQKVVIERGTGVSGIAMKLENAGVIRSPKAFALYNRLHGTQGMLKAGSYSFTGEEGVVEIVRILAGGSAQESKITVPEGFTVQDIDELVAKEGLAPEGAIANCARTCDFSDAAFLPSASGLATRGGRLEGYLFPDTYFVNPAEFDAKDFLARLLKTFDERVVTGLKAELASSGRPLHDVVIMASIVEEEARGAEERAMVAGILWKRIEGGTGLYVDATTRYVLGKPTGALTAADLDVDSPYNTRKYRGLPPGPIASPSLESLRAAMDPAPSEYLYYLHDGNGQIHYARTNEEHNANKSRYLR